MRQPPPGCIPVSSSSFCSRLPAPPLEVGSQNWPPHGRQDGRIKPECFRRTPTSHIADSEFVEYLLCVRIPYSFCTHHYGFDWTFPQCVWMGLIFGLALCWQTLGTLSDAPESMGDLQAAHLWGQIPQNEQLLHRTFILGTAQAMTQIPLLSHILHLSIVITSCLHPP